MKIPNEPGISRERWPFILILYVRVIEASLSVASAYNLRYIFFRLIPTECLRTYQLKKKKKKMGDGQFCLLLALPLPYYLLSALLSVMTRITCFSLAFFVSIIA
jgi:hypothetical protein